MIPRSRLVSLITKPLLLGGVAYLAARRAGSTDTPALASTAVIAAFDGARSSPRTLGRRLEEALTDFILRRVRQLSRRTLPGLFQLIVQVFRSLVDRLERGIYAVDEWLRSRRASRRSRSR